jgi:hypothetical protein
MGFQSTSAKGWGISISIHHEEGSDVVYEEMSSIIAQMLSSFHFTKHLSPSISLVLYQKKKKNLASLLGLRIHSNNNKGRGGPRWAMVPPK